MSKIVDSYPSHKKDRKVKILKKQAVIDAENSKARQKVLDDELKARDESRKGKVARKQAEAKIREEGEGKLSLKDAIDVLNHEDATHWTKKEGLPDLTVLTELTGKRVSRDDVEKAAPGIVRKT